MNQVYLEKKFNVRKNESQVGCFFLFMRIQVDRNELLISRWVDQWRIRRQKTKVWDFWQKYSKTKSHESKNVNFCQQFYERGLVQRAYRHMKLFSQVAGNRMYKRRIEEKITIEVKAKLEEKKLQLEFLESMIKELEERYRIELRKKAILKNQCDQAYLRGVSAIS